MVKAIVERLGRLQLLVRKRDMDLVMIGPGANKFYLAGFSDDAGKRPILLIIPAEGAPRFSVPELYAY